MKYATIKRSKMSAVPVVPYPNAATRREMLHKVLDLVLVCAMGAGTAACLLFFLVLA